MSEISGGESLTPQLKSVLQEGTDNFTAVIINESSVPYMLNDQFGSLAMQAHQIFMRASLGYLAEHSNEYGPDVARQLEEKLFLSKFGMGVIALFLELAPIVTLRDLPEIALDPDGATQIARSSYDFIDLIINSGSIVGADIATSWIRPDFDEINGLSFNGTIVNGQIVSHERLDKFKIGATTESGDLKLIPREIEESIKTWESQIQDKRDNPVNCPAQIFKNPATGLPYTRQIFDAMAEHTRRHIYPSFIPIVYRALQISEV
jgi:hypothetical protein